MSQKIYFNDHYGLTQAVLNGTKTMTRRLIPQKVVEYALNVYRQDYYSAALDYLNDQEALEGWLIVEKKSRYKLGETVAVAQSYKAVFEETLDYTIPRYHWLDDHIGKKGFENKMFVKANEMPHQIQITNIKIERLQDISDEDCLKEGVICETFDDGTPLCYKVLGIYDKPKSLLLKEFITPREAFAALINRPGVGRKGLWESNPWVVVYEFKLVK